MSIFRPIRACELTDSADENEIFESMKALRYPVIVTEKVDGIRALKFSNGLFSKYLKLIRSRQLQEASKDLPKGMDMELWSPNLKFQSIVSAVMSQYSPLAEEIRFVLLDDFTSDKGYMQRLESIRKIDHHRIKHIDWHWALDAKELMFWYKQYTEDGKEGIVFRTPTSPYKQGDCTLREQYCVKLAAIKTSEASIVGFIELETNTNTASSDARGYTQRSSAKSGMIKMGTLGALIVKDVCFGEFRIGTGFTEMQRKVIWNNQDKYLGRIVSYSYKPYGVKDKPRAPVYRGIREGY